jgi:hypothetical protein
MDWRKIYRIFREKGPKQLIKNRVSWYVNPLLKKHWYPLIHPRFIYSLARENKRRRARLETSVSTLKPGKVFVVICVDTEGPCAFRKNKDWDAIQVEFDELARSKVRSQYADSRGQPFAVNWFVVDWVGGEACPRALAAGHHAVFDPYRDWIEELSSIGLRDEIYWHYHHGFEGRLGSWNRDWTHLPLYEEVICRRIIERNSFPTVYRAGNTWEDNVVSRWLNRFIPFDLSSQGPYKNVHYDWGRAPTDWRLYHPSPDDYQSVGQQQRLMGRSIGIESDQFVKAEVEQAFLDASEGRDAYVSFWLHDYESMTESILRALSRVHAVAQEYPEVEWAHCTALDLFRSLGDRPVKEALEITGSIDGRRIEVQFNQPIFGEPWLALESSGRFLRVDMEPVENRNQWTARIDAEFVFTKVAVAAADISGQSTILNLL